MNSLDTSSCRYLPLRVMKLGLFIFLSMQSLRHARDPCSEALCADVPHEGAGLFLSSWMGASVGDWDSEDSGTEESGPEDEEEEAKEKAAEKAGEAKADKLEQDETEAVKVSGAGAEAETPGTL